MAMRGTKAQEDNEPGPHLPSPTVPGNLVSLAVPKCSDPFLKAAVPLILPQASSHIKPALAARVPQAQTSKGRQNPLIHSFTHPFIRPFFPFSHPAWTPRVSGTVQPHPA